MKKILVIMLIIAPFMYLSYKKPLLDDHKIFIYSVATEEETGGRDDILELSEWDDLELLDWVFLTATQDTEKKTLVSYGILSYRKVVDKDWGIKRFATVAERGR